MNVKHVALTVLTTAVIVGVIFRVKAIRTAVTGLA